MPNAISLCKTLVSWQWTSLLKRWWSTPFFIYSTQCHTVVRLPRTLVSAQRSSILIKAIDAIHTCVSKACYYWSRWWRLSRSVPRHFLNQCLIITLRLRQNGRYLPDDIFKRINLNETGWISLKIWLKFVPKVRINNIPALVQIMGWRLLGDKPLSEPMMV